MTNTANVNTGIMMANEAKKTEHSGAKKGNGAYWGPKASAKEESNKKRRSDAKQIVKTEIKIK